MRKFLRSFIATLCLGLFSFFQARSQCAASDVTQPANQTVVNSTMTSVSNFSGSVVGATFKWSNDKPSIGLAASGAGNIASFIATNTTSSPITATVTVTPYKGSVSYAYIPNRTSGTVSVVDLTNNTVIKTITVGGAPFGVVAAPDGSKVYITNNGSIIVINTITNTVDADIAIGTTLTGIVVSSDGAKVYAVDFGNNRVAVINTSNNAVITTIPVGFGPNGIAISPDNSKIYVADNQVSVINTATNAVATTVTVEATPVGVAITPDGKKVYVTNRSSSSVSVINTADNTVIKTIAVGTNPAGVAVSPDGNKVYVTNNASNNVSVINTATNTVNATVPVDNIPFGVAVSPDGTKVYITNRGSNNVSVINTASNTVATTVTVGSDPGSFGNMMAAVPCPGTSKSFTITVNPTDVSQPANQTVCPGNNMAAVNFSSSVSGATFKWSNDKPAIGLAASGSGNISAFPATNTTTSPVTATVTVTPYKGIAYAYVPNSGDNTVSVVDVNTGLVVKTIAVGNNPEGIAVSPDGSKVYVANYDANTVSVINTADNTVSATVAVGDTPYGIAVSPDGSKVYVTNYNSKNVSVITTADNTVIKTIAVGTTPSGVAVSPDGSKVYVTNSSSNTISVINTADNTVSVTVSVGGGPSGVIVSPDGSKVYVANSGTNMISVINTADNTVIKTIAVGNTPYGIAVSPDGSKVYVTNYNSKNVSVITTADNTVIKTIAVGTTPEGIAVSPDGSKVYVTNRGSNNVSVINTADNTVSATVAVGKTPEGLGNMMALVPVAGSSKSFTLTVNPVPAVPTVSVGSALTFCSGGSVVLTSSATTGNQWYNGSSLISGATSQTYTATTTGDYKVVVAASGCTSPASTPVGVTVKFKPAIPLITALGNTLTSSASSGNQWYLNNMALSGATAQTYQVQESGHYTVQVTQDGCTSTSTDFNFVPTRIDEPAAWNGEVLAYPNPMEKILIVKNTTGHKLHVQLYNNLGQTVYDCKLVGTQSSINVEGLTRGTYQLMITDVQKGKSISQTILKQ